MRKLFFVLMFCFIVLAPACKRKTGAKTQPRKTRRVTTPRKKRAPRKVKKTRAKKTTKMKHDHRPGAICPTCSRK